MKAIFYCGHLFSSYSNENMLSVCNKDNFQCNYLFLVHQDILYLYNSDIFLKLLLHQSSVIEYKGMQNRIFIGVRNLMFWNMRIILHTDLIKQNGYRLYNKILQGGFSMRLFHIDLIPVLAFLFFIDLVKYFTHSGILYTC